MIFPLGMHFFFALPEGYRDRPSIMAVLAVMEGDSPFKAWVFLLGWLDLLSPISQSVDNLVGVSLQDTHPCVHRCMTPFSKLPTGAGMCIIPRGARRALLPGAPSLPLALCTGVRGRVILRTAS